MSDQIPTRSKQSATATMELSTLKPLRHKPSTESIDTAWERPSTASTETTRERPSTASTSTARERSSIFSAKTATDAVGEDGAPFTHARLMLVTLAMMFTFFATEMDRTVVSTIAPSITSEFNSLDSVGWYGGAYLLTYAAFLPVMGQLYRVLPSRMHHLFLTWFCLFEVGSVVCATAKSSSIFIFGRAFAGFGAAGVLVGGMSILGSVVPLQYRTLYFAVITSMTGVAALVGPPLGGVFSDSRELTWRWCFWLNLPIGALAMFTFILVYRPKPESTGKVQLNTEEPSTFQKLRSIDLLGALLVIATIVSLLLPLQWGGVEYPWGDPKVWSLFIVFTVPMAAFVFLQIKRGKSALFPPRVLKSRNVIVTAFISLLLPMGQYVHIYFLPILFQASQSLSAKASGQLLIAYLISDTVAAIITGAIVGWVGYFKPFMCCGLAFFTIGAGVLYTVGAHYSTSISIVGQLCSGTGMGMAASLLIVSLHAVVPPEDHVTVNTLVVFLMTLGGVLGSNLGQVVFSNTLDHWITQHVPNVDPAIVEKAGATGFRQVLNAESIPLVEKAFAFAVSQAFIIPITCGGVVTLLSLGIKGVSFKKTKEQT